MVASSAAVLGSRSEATGEAADGRDYHVGGFRAESHLRFAPLGELDEGRIPRELLWIMDDPSAMPSVYVSPVQRAARYIWDHERESVSPIGTADPSQPPNVQLLANSFTQFVCGIPAQPH